MWPFPKKRKPNHEFNDEDRDMAADARRHRQKLRQMEMQIDMEKAQMELDEIKAERQEANQGPEDELSQLLGMFGVNPAMLAAMAQQAPAQSPQQTITYLGDPLPAPQAPHPTPAPPVDPAVLDKLMGMMPPALRQAVKSGAVSPEQFDAISKGLYSRMRST